MPPRRDLLARWLVPLLLTAVAVVQIVRVHRVDQSSWSGVGFGMFATVDNEDSRFVRGVAVAADGSETLLAIPPALDHAEFELRVVPTEDRAEALATAWRAHLADPPPALRVEVWGVALDTHGPTLKPAPLVAVTAR